MTLVKSLMMGSKKDIPGHPHRVHRSKKVRRRGHVQVPKSKKRHIKQKLEALRIKELESDE
jgi:hypothetical protein